MFVHAEATLEGDQNSAMRLLAEPDLWQSAARQVETLGQVDLWAGGARRRSAAVLPPRISAYLSGRLWRATVAVTVYGLAHGRSRVFLNADVRGLRAALTPWRLRPEVKAYLEHVLAILGRQMSAPAANQTETPESG